MEHYTPKSKGTWGREEQKSAEELNRLCNEFFEKLVVPAEWKDMGWRNVKDIESGYIFSIGKLFRDMRTSGIDLMDYRICFFTASQRGGIVEKSIIDFGKYGYKSMGHGIFTIEKLNEFIAERYNEIETKNPSASLVPDPHPASPQGGGERGDNDNADGLQHFRDRFGT